MSERWLVISHEATNSGAPRMLLDLLRAVRVERGENWDCQMLFNHGGPLMSEFARLGPVHRLSHPWSEGSGLLARCSRRLSRNFSMKPRNFAKRVADWKERGSNGIILSNTGTNGRLLAALPDGAGRVVSYVHELGYGLRRFNQPAELAATLRRTDLFLAVSSAVAEDLVALGVKPEKMRLLPNFLPSLPAPAQYASARVEMCARLQVSPQTRFVTGCGHIDRVKGPELFVETAHRVTKQFDDPVQFIWLGGDVDRPLAEKVRAVGRDVVRFTGAVDDPSVYFAASDLVLVTSKHESFSRVALEAGALGRPVLAFAAARGPADLLPTDCLVAELSSNAMAAAVLARLRNPESTRHAGAALRDRIARGFLSKHWVQTFISLMEEGERG